MTLASDPFAVNVFINAHISGTLPLSSLFVYAYNESSFLRNDKMEESQTKLVSLKVSYIPHSAQHAKKTSHEGDSSKTIPKMSNHIKWMTQQQIQRQHSKKKEAKINLSNSSKLEKSQVTSCCWSQDESMGMAGKPLGCKNSMPN